MSFIRQQQEAISDLFTHAMDYTGGTSVIYKGDAAPGSLKSEPKWRIAKFTYDTNSQVTDIQWAGGTNELDKIWDNRGSYTYT